MIITHTSEFQTRVGMIIEPYQLQQGDIWRYINRHKTTIFTQVGPTHCTWEGGENRNYPPFYSRTWNSNPIEIIGSI